MSSSLELAANAVCENAFTGLAKLSSAKELRAQFQLDPELIHLSGFFLSSHPKVVRDAIEYFRSELDRNPVDFWNEKSQQCEAETRAAAASYINADPNEIALVESTTMGLALVLTALKINSGDEVVTSTHDHPSMSVSLKFLRERTGVSLKRISLYQNPFTVTEDEIVESLARSLSKRTRYVSLTWIHSGTGLKLPIAKISKLIASVNERRKDADRILLCIDGVHGLGVELTDMKALGCDIFIAGTHKWLFGPRGTGMVWAKETAWARVYPTVPTFSLSVQNTAGERMTPGGFQAFEHRWALKYAFDFHARIGPEKTTRSIHELNLQMKEGLLEIPKVRLVTPLSQTLSAGIVCFAVEGIAPEEVVSRLRKNKIIASAPPYITEYPRFALGLLNTADEIQQVLSVLKKEFNL